MSIDWGQLDRCGPATLRGATVATRELPAHQRQAVDQYAAHLRDLCDRVGVPVTDPATVAAIAIGVQLTANSLATIAMRDGPVDAHTILVRGMGVLAVLADHAPPEVTR